MAPLQPLTTLAPDLPDALGIFLQHAHHHLPHWTPTQTDLDRVGRLIEAVDADPRALRWLARQLRFTGLEAMVAGADEPATLVMGSPLEGQIRVAFGELDPTAQQALRRLCLVREPLSLAQAASLTALSRVHLWPVLDRLLDQGWLVTPGAPGAVRMARVEADVVRRYCPSDADRRHFLSWAVDQAVLGWKDRVAAAQLAVEARDPSAIPLTVGLARQAADESGQPLAHRMISRVLDGLGADAPARGALYAAQAQLYRSTDERAREREACEAAIEALAPGATRRWSRLQLAELDWRQQRLEVATEAFRALDREAQEHGDVALERAVVGGMAVCLHYTGEVGEALMAYDRSIALADSALARAVCQANRADLLLSLWRLPAAGSLLTEALTVSREAGRTGMAARIGATLGECERRRGRMAQAQVHLDRAVRDGQAVGDRLPVAMAVASLAELAAEQGDLAAARRQIAAGVTLGVAEDVPEAAAALCRARAVVAAAEGLLPHARRWMARGEARLSAHCYALTLFEHRLVWLSLERRVGDATEVARLHQLLEAALSADDPTWSALRARIGTLEPAMTLQVGPKMDWVAWRGEQLSLGRRHIQRRLLEALVVAHEADPHQGVDLYTLIAAGWPDSRLPPDRLTNRAYVALHALRKGGLQDLIQTVEGGYRLDPSTVIRR